MWKDFWNMYIYNIHATHNNHVSLFFLTMTPFTSTGYHWCCCLFGSRAHVHSIMMTACDMSSATKPWETHRHSVECLMREFFQQVRWIYIYCTLRFITPCTYAQGWSFQLWVSLSTTFWLFVKHLEGISHEKAACRWSANEKWATKARKTLTYICAREYQLYELLLGRQGVGLS